MRSLRSRPVTGDRVATGLVSLAAVVAVAGCGALGSSGPGDSGPPRLTPNPQPDVAAAMIESIPEPGELLNACELLGLTTGEIMDLTGADMPEVDPTGSGDLGMVCTYGGPGSPERAEAERSAAAEAAEAEADTTTTNGAAEGANGTAEADGTDGTEDDDDNTDAADAEVTTDPASPGATSTDPTDATSTDTMSTETSATTSASPVFDPDVVPDTFAAGVVKPRSGSTEALSQQSTLLGVRYACSEIRGADASSVREAPGAPEAPAAVGPELPTAYIDCAAAPTGGGLEVRTILVADNDLWHLALISPGTPRSPETEAAALEGLHRVALEILS